MWDSLDPRSSDIRERDPRDRSRDVRDPRNEAWLDPRDALSKGLDLPRGVERERVYVDEERCDLRGSETRTLATVGAFRVVPLDDLRDPRDRSEDPGRGDLSRLRSAGLVQTQGFETSSYLLEILLKNPEDYRPETQGFETSRPSMVAQYSL